jgi:hypothetical protein
MIIPSLRPLVSVYFPSEKRACHSFRNVGGVAAASAGLSKALFTV